jgi:hypothetical protein
MAAALAQLNLYLQNVLLINQPDTRAALNQQGLEAFGDFDGLTDKDIKNICANVRKPGGTIPNPNAGAANQPATITNPGVHLGYVFERRLEMLRYYVYHCVRVQRQFVPQQMTLARLLQVYHLKETEEVVKEETIKLPTPITKVEDIRTNIEDLDNYLLRKLGETGLPLAYIVREDVGLPAVDMGFGMPDYAQEMILRGEHATATYQNDNKEVWNVIRHLTHGGSTWSWVSQYARTSNGRAAYMAIKAHYLGPSYRSRIQASCDATLNKTYFDGNRNFTLESYTTTLQKAFTDLEICGEPVTENRKVRLLLAGIVTPQLLSAKGVVSATPTLSDNFETAANFLTEQFDKLKVMTTSRRSISATGLTPDKRSNQRKGRTGKPTAQKKRTFMPHKEWWALSDAQRTKIREERQKQHNNVRTAAAEEREPTVPVAQGVTFAPDTYPPANDRKVSVVVSRRQPSNSSA